MSKNKIVVLSDIHISTNEPTNWYQKNFHERYLSAILDYVINNAATIQELVLLGDIFDSWTYPPNVRPPAFAEIIAANPSILGVNGKLSKVCQALDGNVTYVNGNHDIDVTKDDWDRVQKSSGYQVKYCPDPIYYVQTGKGQKIAFTHGHTFTLFNAPDHRTPISPIPVGYFVTRAVGYMLNHTLKPGETVADLADQGSPNSIDLGGLVSSVASLISSGNLVNAILDYIMDVTRIPETEPIVLPDGKTTSIGAAKEMYKNLQGQWIADSGQGENGTLALLKSVIADLDGTYIAWFAQQSALKSNSDLIVLGHTHFPKLGITNGLVKYANGGFECPSSPDLTKKAFTFSVVDTDNCQAIIHQVTKQNNTYQIVPFDASPDSVIAGTSMDYSCYIIIDNPRESSTLNLINYSKDRGNYVVAPPEQILPGQQGKFWLQDYTGLKGSRGSVTYSTGAGSQSLTFTYDCPMGAASNKCSGANFYTSNDGVNWESLNKIKKFGYPLHPFFVKFVL